MINKSITRVTGMLMIATSCATAQSRSQYVFDDANMQESERRLDQQIDFEFVEAPLGDVMKYISQTGDIPC